MKPNQAKNKKCIYLVSTKETDCKANQCMHWRWWAGSGKTQGYCGLSGKPEEQETED